MLLKELSPNRVHLGRCQDSFISEVQTLEQNATAALVKKDWTYEHIWGNTATRKGSADSDFKTLKWSPASKSKRSLYKVLLRTLKSLSYLRYIYIFKIY